MLGKVELQQRAGSLRRGTRWALLAIGVGLVVGLLQLVPEREASGDTAAKVAPAELEPVEGTELKRVRLTEQAARRLDLQTARVRESPGAGGAASVVPYSAIIYDPAGGTWVYTAPEPLVFVRARIAVERIESSRAFLSSGPPVGTPLVTVGAAELYGTELEVDH